MSVVDQLGVTGEISTVAPRTRKRFRDIELTPKKVSRKSLMHFSRQLAVFVKAGIPILDGLDAMQEEMGDKHFRDILAAVASDLREGSTFADAVARHESAFPAYYVGILRSAEFTGRLDDVLLQLSDYIERDLEARRKVTSALAYPAVILAVSVVVVTILVGFVLPRFEDFFDSLGATLPLPTRVLLSAAGFLADYGVFLAAGIVAVLFSVTVALSRGLGAGVRDRLLLRLPVIGDVLRHVLLERFTRVLSAMMYAGVPLPEALHVTTTATKNRVFTARLAVVREAMMRGEGLSRPLSESGLFPAAARQMFAVGERTGTLDQQLATAATYFDRELDYKIKRFTALFEPAVLLFVGVVVGFVAIALVSAMYGIFTQTQVY